jgi:hypothetical protein
VGGFHFEFFSGYQEIKKHPFFHSIQWASLPQQFPPPIKYMRSSSIKNMRGKTLEREEKLKQQKSSPW